MGFGEFSLILGKTSGVSANGSSTWDQITYLKTTCYVNGYFTDSNCSSSMLPLTGVVDMADDV
jgi:hypothetical protein